MRKVTVTLGDREYTIPELPTRRNEVWREALQEQLAPVVQIVKEASKEELSADNLDNLAGTAERVIRVAMESPEAIRDLVIAYSTELQEDESHLLDHAYDSEIISAFMQILGLAYPFGELLKTLGSLSDGISQKETNGQRQRKK